MTKKVRERERMGEISHAFPANTGDSKTLDEITTTRFDLPREEPAGIVHRVDWSQLTR